MTRRTDNQILREIRQVIEGAPAVGMGATVRIGTDSYPYTVTSVEFAGTVVTVQEDSASPAEGHDYYSAQKYDYAPNPKGEKHTFRLGGDGTWHEIAMNAKTSRYNRLNNSSRLVLGTREKYQDPTF